MTSPKQPSDEDTPRIVLTVTASNVDSEELTDDESTVVADLETACKCLVARTMDEPEAGTTEIVLDDGDGPLVARCPDCGTAVDFQDIHLGNGRYAYAWTQCTSETCQWAGNATFALVDLDRAS